MSGRLVRRAGDRLAVAHLGVVAALLLAVDASACAGSTLRVGASYGRSRDPLQLTASRELRAQVSLGSGPEQGSEQGPAQGSEPRRQLEPTTLVEPAQSAASGVFETGPSGVGGDDASRAAPIPRSPALEWHFARELARAVRRQVASRFARVELLTARARRAAWLPGVRVRAGYGADSSLRYSPTTADPNRWLSAGARDFSYGAQLSWQLDQLVWSGQEPVFERQRDALERLSLEQVQQALELLFKYQALQLELAQARSSPAPGEPPHRTARKAPAVEVLVLELGQIGVRLDLLTAGWFSRQSARLSASSQHPL